jgi:hypothetical protein
MVKEYKKYNASLNCNPGDATSAICNKKVSQGTREDSVITREIVRLEKRSSVSEAPPKSTKIRGG